MTTRIATRGGELDADGSDGAWTELPHHVARMARITPFKRMVSVITAWNVRGTP